MYRDKVKKEFLRKISELKSICGQLADIRAEANSLKKFEDIVTDDYLDLIERQASLYSEISEIMIDTKYDLLAGLSLDNKTNIDFFYSLFSGNSDEEIVKNLDFNLLALREGMKERLKKIKIVPMEACANKRTADLYNQSIRCFIFGAFDASCVLCRAIAESIAKGFIEYHGYKILLLGEKKKVGQMTISGILKEKFDMPKEIIAIYSKIGRKADCILHSQDAKAEENAALEQIELLQAFIKKFPKML